MGTDKVKAVLPWGKLIKNQSDFFDCTYWLADIQVVEPSKIDKASATALLNSGMIGRKRSSVPPSVSKLGETLTAIWSRQPSLIKKSSTRRATAGTRPMMSLVRKAWMKERTVSLPLIMERKHQCPTMPGNKHRRDQYVLAKICNGMLMRHCLVTGQIIHSSTNSVGARHTKASVTVDKPPAARAAKELTSFIPTTRSGKWHAAAPISDTPAKRTWSKAAIVEAPKPRRGRK